MSERGYISLARGVLDHPIVGARKPYADSEAWLWLLFEAAWKPRRVRVTNGRTVSALSIERGQLSYSLSYMATAWGWSVKHVRTFLSRLETDRQIDTQTGTQQTVITISNYGLYQRGGDEAGRQTETQLGSERAGSRQQTEEGNKVIKESTRSRAGEIEGFAEWYEVFPKHVDRRAAAKAYRAALARGDCSIESLLLAARAYRTEQQGVESKYIKHPATWLNAASYLNKPQCATSAPAGPKIEAPTRDPRSYTEADWRPRLDHYNNGGDWPMEHWGPEPGKPGCLVPPEFLISPVTACNRAIGASS